MPDRVRHDEVGVRANIQRSQLVDERMEAYPCSGEINYTVVDSSAIIGQILRQYESQAISIDNTDGVSVEFADWRFNLRTSNTEPLLRLNVETRANPPLLQERMQELSKAISQNYFSMKQVP